VTAQPSNTIRQGYWRLHKLQPTQHIGYTGKNHRGVVRVTPWQGMCSCCELRFVTTHLSCRYLGVPPMTGAEAGVCPPASGLCSRAPTLGVRANSGTCTQAHTCMHQTYMHQTCSQPTVTCRPSFKHYRVNKRFTRRGCNFQAMQCHRSAQQSPAPSQH
jgi:hypothetical protein